MRILIISALLLVHGAAFAQSADQPALSYTFGELRYLDVDGGGDGFEVAGSFQFDSNWFGVANIASYDLGRNVDGSSFEIGAGYIFPFQDDWDFQANARFIRVEVDTPFASVDDTGIGLTGGVRGMIAPHTGIGLTGGVRGMIAPQFEVRGNVNYVNVDESDVYLDLAGDWYFTPEFAAGLSFEFGGDVDVWTLGARYYFK